MATHHTCDKCGQPATGPRGARRGMTTLVVDTEFSDSTVQEAVTVCFSIARDARDSEYPDLCDGCRTVLLQAALEQLKKRHALASAACPECNDPLTTRTITLDGKPTYCDSCDREVAQ